MSPVTGKVKGKTIFETAFLIFLALVCYALLLVSCENQIIYHPYKHPDGFWVPESYGLKVEDIFFESGDGVKLHGWYVPAEKPVATLLWYHGNAGNLTHRLHNILELRPLKLNIFIFDYRGYGRSEGKPDQPGVYLDSQAAYDTLVRVKKVSPESLFLFGRSLGGVCALEVASKNPAAGLILESTFTSARDMADTIFPFFPLKFLLKSKYDALGQVSSVNIPKLFMHGTEDEIVPYKMGRKLFEAAAGPKEFYDIQGAGHNDTWQTGGKAYFDTIERFIRQNIKKETALEEKS